LVGGHKLWRRDLTPSLVVSLVQSHSDIAAAGLLDRADRTTGDRERVSCDFERADPDKRDVERHTEALRSAEARP
jgi:hypothetical protein